MSDFAVGYVELGAVPGAGYDLSLELALVQWSAHVGASAAAGVEGAIDVCDE